ncbi:unnamed protein product [Parnassius apollo]|uniref:(apollo) hypothetical protein n=1 Tax=Parnassius apollo TaxID=110799 RepID=A0A8S3XFY5_PARAO|nr:unnamed protein product [Parnassius apollo]
MMSQHFSSMFEQIGNFTKNSLVNNNKLVKEKENKANANHVSLGAAGAGGNQQASPHKHGQPPPPLRKPCKLRNLTSKAESYDTLYSNSTLVFCVFYKRIGFVSKKKIFQRRMTHERPGRY